MFIHFAAVKSAFYIWINGEKVGYSQDSKLPAEFNVTKFIKPGKNSIALEVYRWSDGSYLECQDFWRISGIERDVYLYARPKVQLADYFAKAGLENNYTDGVFDLSVAIKNIDAKKQKGIIAVEISRDNQSVYSSSSHYELNPNSENTFAFKQNIPQVKTWSAEIPNLYQLNIVIKDKKGNVLEAISRKLGLASIELFTAGGSSSDLEIPGLLLSDAQLIKNLVSQKINPPKQDEPIEVAPTEIPLTEEHE